MKCLNEDKHNFVYNDLLSRVLTFFNMLWKNKIKVQCSTAFSCIVFYYDFEPYLYLFSIIHVFSFAYIILYFLMFFFILKPQYPWYLSELKCSFENEMYRNVPGLLFWKCLQHRLNWEKVSKKLSVDNICVHC